MKNFTPKTLDAITVNWQDWVLVFYIKEQCFQTSLCSLFLFGFGGLQGESRGPCDGNCLFHS